MLVLFQNYIFKGELSHDLILNLLIGAILFLACLASFLIAAAAPFLTFIFAASRGNEIHKALNEQITAIQAGTIHAQADFNKLEEIDAQKVTEIQEGIYWLLPRVKILRRINTLMCLSSVSMILCYFFLFSNFGFALPFSAMNFIIGSTSTIMALIFFLLSVALLAISGSQIFKFKINEY
ncbi:hypothetical protein CC99x_007000 [Candidatus Berkiella cookevillensis]|uniref:DUF2721 domain-containing protein n=1 Tax=Candidatus Berkiella cookevillensis TaxID=437022 RepID=A0AAE3HRG3_9GAMM|nr:hypothetical protein [Candidatus Berkiella cookevillensis]MCS5708653.1 hypothetical protein [Candidatus Berkiella cookevillensis]